MELAQLLAFAVKSKAQALHLVPNMPPQLKVGDKPELLRINIAPLTRKEIDAIVDPLLNTQAREALRFGGKCELPYEVKGLGIFTLCVTADAVEIAIPVAPTQPPGKGFFGRLFK